MSNTSGTTTLPYYVKFCLNLFSVFMIGYLLFIGSDILLPIFFAIILAMLLLPVNNWLVRLGLPEVLAMLLSILLALLFIAGIIYFLSSQIANFANDWPSIKQHLQDHIQTVRKWISDQFDISYKQQDAALKEASTDMKSTGGSVVGTTLVSAAGSLINIVLLPIYTFLIMYYRRLIRKFFIDSFGEKNQGSVLEVIEESKTIIQGYMVGLLIEMAVVTALNAAGFFIIGIQYAFFLALLAAILNMIPYVGMLVASVICMIITLTTSDNMTDVLWVGLILVIVQFLDNNLLMPYIVSSKVRINALANIVGVLVGGAIGGVGGMFLSIPGVAIMKVVFERVDGLKPWGLILGDDLSMVNPKKRGRISRRNRNEKDQSTDLPDKTGKNVGGGKSEPGKGQKQG
ncbi:MAG: AI-2E family transporter [Chitinophagaceae bacterium]|nr:MAG: AI-2E family transporter [Chitinophagaceae bacterium]